MPSLTAKLDKLYSVSPVLPFDNSSRIVIMSDCHRGQGNGADNFLPNSMIFQGALEYYWQNGYTYIELGDGDELWENRCIGVILRTYSHIFRLLARFQKENRLFLIYGNHDIVKRRKSFARAACDLYACDASEEAENIFRHAGIPESLILENRDSLQRLFLVHGHQGSLLNDELWHLGRFLVRYLWRPLETIGFTAPTGAGRSRRLMEKIEKQLCSYAASTGRILIAGHTHRPVFARPGDCPYFNDGSCVHPQCITALEIEGGRIRLVRWAVSADPDLSLIIRRETLNGPAELEAYG